MHPVAIKLLYEKMLACDTMISIMYDLTTSSNREVKEMHIPSIVQPHNQETLDLLVFTEEQLGKTMKHPERPMQQPTLSYP